MAGVEQSPEFCTFVSTFILYVFSGPDHMSQAGPVSRAGLSLPGSRHVC